MRSLIALVALSACSVGSPDGPTDAPTAPGRFALRRLTRAEYKATVEELVGAPVPLTADLPTDDSSHGLDAVADALVVSPLHVELWEQTARAVTAELLREALTAPVALTVQAEDPAAIEDGPEWNDVWGDAYIFGSAGALYLPLDVPADGLYEVIVRVRADQAGPEGAAFALSIDELEVGAGVVPLDGPSDWQELRFEVALPQRAVRVGVSFVNDFWDGDLGLDRNLWLDEVRVNGPLDFRYEPNRAWDRWIPCPPDGDGDPIAARECAAEVLGGLVPWAWRRPVAPAEIDSLLSVYDAVATDGGTATEALDFAVRATLASPHFLFHVEPASEGGPVDAWALASRLSYFLWSGPPDAELRARAAAGDLAQPDVLRAQIRRMLRSPQAAALTEELAAQWLGIRLVETAEPDAWAFPEMNATLKASMAGELRAFFRSFVGTDRPLTELLTSEWGYADPTLAAFYGVPMSQLSGFHAFGASSVHRGGWLGTAGIQMALSYPTRTSPVRRGVWVLTQLLCDEPEPPPADVPGFPEPSGEATTVRERLEQHRANPACASCHDDIDPVGLAFEHFDGIGRWRDDEDGVPIDASGALPDGRAFDGVAELQALLAEDPRTFQCMADRFFTWGHHRAPRTADAPHLAHIVEVFTAGGYTLDALVEGVVTSDSFLQTDRTAGRAP